eukprot:CAMPEP_0119035792 /NCGR_PEP_ID=MMETSP1177-20130426/3018_1 /TAXON_ID=2985 /ORGANISM="Ochromonas sp, Strain CCMP1899" /LENGTH=395 /DNA_ID=CAMNT_0006994563 /DNA_START=262 /DNA_END=1449 /DNA_ORIENTATION=+
MQLHTRLLVHLICYAEHQFGDRVVGKSYRKRGEGERMENWIVEIDVIILIYLDLINLYVDDQGLGLFNRANLNFPYFQKMLRILRPWTACLDSLDRKQKSIIVTLSSHAERRVGSIYVNRNEFHLGEIHCQRAITYARQHEGEEEEKTDILYSAFRTCYDLRMAQRKHNDALVCAEEAYNIVAIFYNPVHPKVQLAANALIECLTFKGDLDTAETFAQMTLDSLKDPKNGLDQQSEEVALGYYNLANVIHDQRVDFVKAEKLIRESLRIRTRLYDNDDLFIGNSSGLLAQILQSQGKLGSETKKLLELALLIDTKNYGPDGRETAVSYANLGTLYRNLSEEPRDTDEKKKKHLSIAQSNFKEAVRINTKIFGPTHELSIEFTSILSTITRKLSLS